MFNSEVQFGHAGSCANADRETAVTKNKALAEAGAKVPHSFDDLGDVIHQVNYSIIIFVLRKTKMINSTMAYSERSTRINYWLTIDRLIECRIFFFVMLGLQSAGAWWHYRGAGRSASPNGANGLRLGPWIGSHPQTGFFHDQCQWWTWSGTPLRWNAHQRSNSDYNPLERNPSPSIHVQSKSSKYWEEKDRNIGKTAHSSCI